MKKIMLMICLSYFVLDKADRVVDNPINLGTNAERMNQCKVNCGSERNVRLQRGGRYAGPILASCPSDNTKSCCVCFD